MLRKTHRSKSHKRRHSRRHTRKRGGACPCAMRGQLGGRGGMGGSELGHAYTTGASQELYQMTGRTPGLSSGGARKTLANRQAGKAAKLAARAKRMANEANILNNKAEKLEETAEELEERAKKMGMRANAPVFQPSQHLFNNYETNRGMRNQEKYLTKMMRYENEESGNNFNNVMRQIHKNRMNRINNNE